MLVDLMTFYTINLLFREGGSVAWWFVFFTDYLDHWFKASCGLWLENFPCIPTSKGYLLEKIRLGEGQAPAFPYPALAIVVRYLSALQATKLFTLSFLLYLFNLSSVEFALGNSSFLNNLQCMMIMLLMKCKYVKKRKKIPNLLQIFSYMYFVL